MRMNRISTAAHFLTATVTVKTKNRKSKSENRRETDDDCGILDCQNHFILGNSLYCPIDTALPAVMGYS